MYLIAELGEVMQETLKLVKAHEKHKDADLEHVRDNLGMEIYDGIWNLCDLANIAGIELEAAFAKKVALNRNRQW